MTDEEILFKCKRFSVARVLQTMPDGRQHAREVVRHPGAVTILPLLGDGRLVMIRNFRAAIGETLLELPAGTLEPNEEPEQTARRELAEETGYQCGALELLGVFYTSPGILDEKMYLYRATDLQSGPRQLDAGEDIETELVGLDEVHVMARDGRIRDAKTLAGLLYHAALPARRA